MHETPETVMKEEQKPGHDNMSSSLIRETKSKVAMERLIPLHSTRVSAVRLLEVLLRANKFMLITTSLDSVLGGVEGY